MAVKFKPKPGKPHIVLHKGDFGFYIWPSKKSEAEESVRYYCKRVTPGFYETPGDAARALHYGSANK